MSKLEFTNITVIYNEEKVNKKLCKNKRLLANIRMLISPFLFLILLFFGLLFLYKFYSLVLLFIISFLIVGCLCGIIYLTQWLIYHNVCASFFFVEELFKIKDIYAGWYNNKILIRAQYSYGYQHYSLQGFVSNIHNNKLEITDKSDRCKPIHIYIDVTNDDKTEILIENAEENNE